MAARAVYLCPVSAYLSITIVFARQGQVVYVLYESESTSCVLVSFILRTYCFCSAFDANIRIAVPSLHESSPSLRCSVHSGATQWSTYLPVGDTILSPKVMIHETVGRRARVNYSNWSGFSCDPLVFEEGIINMLQAPK